MQRFTVDKNGGIAQRAKRRGVIAEFDYYFKSVNFIIGKIDSILRRCRELNIQIMYLRLVSDRKEQSSFDPKFQHGNILPEKIEDELFLEEIEPKDGEIVIDRTCYNPFNCTDFEEILRKIGVKYLILCGVRSPGYLNNTAFDAADRGFGVLIVTDACAGGVLGGTRDLSGGLIRLRSTQQTIELLSRA
jgi:nicotinamidase-related amidase